MQSALEINDIQQIHPGDVAFGVQGARFGTLLGSCVSVILTDNRRTVAAISHVVYTAKSSENAPADVDRSTSWGDAAMQAMFNTLRKNGMNPLLSEAFVYGGGNMFPDQKNVNDVGQSNWEWAMRALAGLDIPVMDSNVGGHYYRRVDWTIGASLPSVRLTNTKPDQTA